MYADLTRSGWFAPHVLMPLVACVRMQLVVGGGLLDYV